MPGFLARERQLTKRFFVNSFVRWGLKRLQDKARGMSPENSYHLADRLADGLYRIYPPVRRLSMRHLRLAFRDRYTDEEFDGIARRSIRNLFRTVVEFLRMPDFTEEYVVENVELSGTEHLDEALSKGRGVILLTAHFGNWELAAARLTLAGYTVNAIARDANDSQVTDLINGIRKQVGTRVISRNELRAALQCLRRNEILAILADQNIRQGGVWIEFFGQPATAAPGTAIFALRTGAPIVPTFTVRDERNHHHGTILPALELIRTGDTTRDIQENTALISRAIEDFVAMQPDHWLWCHRRWKRAEEEGLI